MASKFKLKINVKGFNEARNTPAVRAALDEMGWSIVDATGMPEDFTAFDSHRASRARVVVATATQEGRKAEATDRTLTRAFGAARR